MTISDYQKAKATLPKLRFTARDPRYLHELLEALITVKGHAWCMDVKSERRKMANLMSKEFAFLMKHPMRTKIQNS